jgi:hypothetical protein
MVLIAVAALPIGLVALKSRVVTLHDVKRIQPGMTKDAVQAILGPPTISGGLSCALVRETDDWALCDGWCWVVYGHDSRVLWCNSTADHNVFISTWRQIRWAFGYTS